MAFSYFVTFHNHADATVRISEEDRRSIAELVLCTPRLLKMHLFTPEVARDYYTDDGPSPQLMLQLYFKALPELEAAIAHDGHLQALAAPRWASLAGAQVSHQVMATRPFPVLEPRFQVPSGGLPCSYLVHYPGSAENLNAWLTYYLAHHPQIMKFFPGVREIELFTRVDWCDAMPWLRLNYMQRNKLVFDSPQALTAAMNSPVRHDMRTDFERFPAFAGNNIHYPMATLTLTPT